MPTSVRRWIVIFLAAGGLIVGGLTFSGNLTPDADNTRDIGTASNRVANMYAVNVHADSTSSTGLTVGSGSELVRLQSASVTLNPNAVTDGNATSTNVAMAGVTANSACLVTPRGDFSGASSTVMLSCNVRTAGVATLVFTSTSGTVDLTTSTYDLVTFGF